MEHGPNARTHKPASSTRTNPVTSRTAMTPWSHSRVDGSRVGCFMDAPLSSLCCIVGPIEVRVTCRSSCGERPQHSPPERWPMARGTGAGRLGPCPEPPDQDHGHEGKEHDERQLTRANLRHAASFRQAEGRFSHPTAPRHRVRVREVALWFLARANVTPPQGVYASIRMDAGAGAATAPSPPVRRSTSPVAAATRIQSRRAQPTCWTRAGTSCSSRGTTTSRSWLWTGVRMALHVVRPWLVCGSAETSGRLGAREGRWRGE